MAQQELFDRQLSEALGGLEPSFTVPGRCWIFKMDCVEGMKRLAPLLKDKIQNVVTSPPYNIGKEYEKDTMMEWQTYVKWSAEWMNAAFTLTAPNGSLWLNLGYMEVPSKGRAVPIPYLTWNCSKFYLQQEVVWTYGKINSRNC